jgi:hypothetical protein
MAICTIRGIYAAEPVNGTSVKLFCEAFTSSPTREEPFTFNFDLDGNGNVEVQLRNFLNSYYTQNYPAETLNFIITPGFGKINA